MSEEAKKEDNKVEEKRGFFGNKKKPETEEKPELNQPASDTTEAPTPPASEKEEEEMVSIPKSQLDSILSRIEAVENQDDDIIDDEEDRDHFAKVRLVNGKPLSDVRHAVQTGTNARGEAKMICDITVIGEDGKEEIIEDFDYVSIRDLEFVTCKLIEEKKTKKVKKLGTVPERVFDHAAGLTKETGKKVSLRENIVLVEYIVEFNGKELSLKGLNF